MPAKIKRIESPKRNPIIISETIKNPKLKGSDGKYDVSILTMGHRTKLTVRVNPAFRRTGRFRDSSRGIIKRMGATRIMMRTSD
jgi:hypothetical protein